MEGTRMASKTAVEMMAGANERARGRSAAVHFVGRTDGGYAVYSVDSSRCVDTAYSVTVRGHVYRCTCPRAPRPACWHRAAVEQHRADRQALGLAADGPSVAELLNARMRFELLLAGSAA